MNKKELLEQVKAELELEKNDIVKERIRELVVDLELAQRTVTKLENRLNRYLEDSSDDVIFELE